MGNLSILMLIEVNEKLNSLTGLELSNFPIFDQNTFEKNVGKVNIVKASSGIRTHELQIRCEPSSLLRYAVRWQFGKGKLKNYTYIFYSLFR